MSPLMRVDDVSVSFGPTRALDGVSLTVDPGEVLSVMGASGSGKSTLLHVMAGLVTPDAGAVHLGSQRLDDQSEARRSTLRLHQMGFVFQFGDLVPELTVIENVELPLRLVGTKRQVARSRAEEVLGQLDIADLGDKRLNQVSGGEAQRAAVARALAPRPAIIFADEPTGSLDTLTGEAVMEALVTAAAEGAAVVLVTHDARIASWARRNITLRDGRIVGAA